VKGLCWFSGRARSNDLGRRGSSRGGNVLFAIPICCEFHHFTSEVQIDGGEGEFDVEFVFLGMVVLESRCVDFILGIHTVCSIGFVVGFV
jgi:hypothetical protein